MIVAGHFQESGVRKLLFAGVALAVLWGVLRPESPPTPFPSSDKVGHFLAFMALALSARWAFARASAAWLWGGLLLAAPGLEWLQHWVSPVRTRSLGDAVANLLGVVLALVLWWLWARWRARAAASSAAIATPPKTGIPGASEDSRLRGNDS